MELGSIVEDGIRPSGRIRHDASDGARLRPRFWWGNSDLPSRSLMFGTPLVDRAEPNGGGGTERSGWSGEGGGESNMAERASAGNESSIDEELEGLEDLIAPDGRGERDRDVREAVRRAFDRGRHAAMAETAEELRRLSHDLRTPLNSILGFGQLLELDELEEHQQDAVQQILRAGAAMIEMVDVLVRPLATGADDEVTVEPGRPSPTGDDAPLRILTVVYIEDNLANVRLIERVFALRSNLRLLPATRGDEGIALVAAQQPDLVLLDLHLPDMHGVDVLRALKHDPNTSAIPIAVLTADATPGQIQPLAGEGARFHLTKPLDIDNLFSVIDDVAAELGPA
jgi:CheY-like chemotaxis protein